MKNIMRYYLRLAVIVIIVSLLAYCVHVELYSRLMHVVYSIMDYTVIGINRHVNYISNILYIVSFILGYVFVYFSLVIVYKYIK